ncbi:myo-inositol-1(or 4)-monophosphatase [Quadrisphaera granulorum]|uniref:Inositol-1-monophosphatase n=1 Tax=Quadrisphaera granulorum TaxID=317664 RepID=A0A315ZVP6_9ACTN|nr:inositol monophosphatase family protein [Quadrisphaera granulorum]PWJ49283.1 myo-inositol-1(or 4)-monophosphatase [Quadrisphaera granulorum]SZE98200.1 myo-inositol-1(or 4)-monophosphatase [Quadrisphaera granulorum]
MSPAPTGAGSDAAALTAAEVAALADLAERAARAAGELVRAGRAEHGTVTATKSSRTDVVTDMDTAAERLIRSMLEAERPQDAVLGEEGGATGGTSGLTWVLDPIDGTVNYVYGIPAYAVSVAVVAGPPSPPAWQPVAGCVHNPETGETWTAALGAGSRLNGEALPGPQRPPLAEALVGTGFGYTAQRRAEQAAVVAHLLPRVRDLRRIGSAALDLCAVASGRLDVYYERGLNPWDVAAGWLVASECGVALVGLDGAGASSEMLVAAAPGLAEEVAAAIAGVPSGAGAAASS